jgi:hypothetical protein
MKSKNSCSITIPQSQGKQSLQSLILTNQNNRIDGAVENWNTQQKPQIQSIPGVSAKEPRRYRVTLNGEILGDKLTADEAIKLVKRGGKA